MTRTALFVVDIQRALANSPSTEIPNASRIRSAGTSILAHARASIDSARARNQTPDLDIIIVQHDEDAKNGPLQPGTEAWDLVFPVRKNDANERLVSKSVRNTFISNPQLSTQLQARGISTIVVFGIQSECCVLSTCLGALKEGFEVILLKGAHSTYDLNGKKAGVLEEEVQSEVVEKGGVVIDWEEWVKTL
ncbi:hypothetical protein N0V94_008403 [Neodidymelliopsis sp. IMI 364377]|nr:hypothetical protein N0V94_008403 [Neodidymelliopsis sp. IMI 364377]